MRNDYFTYTNISPNERIFLIDFGNEKEFELKEIINCIIKKWTKILKRESNSYCPYIFINNYDKNKLIELKKDLYSDGIKFIDGFTFDGAEFNVEEEGTTVLVKQTYISIDENAVSSVQENLLNAELYAKYRKQMRKDEQELRDLRYKIEDEILAKSNDTEASDGQ